MNSLFTIKLRFEAKFDDESIRACTQIVPRVMHDGAMLFPSGFFSLIHIDAEHNCEDGDDEQEIPKLQSRHNTTFNGEGSRMQSDRRKVRA